MKVLITGGAGFVAPWLHKELVAGGHEVIMTARSGEMACDLTQLVQVEELLHKTQPEAIVHMAGLSSPARVNQEPVAAFQSNILATTQLSQAVLKQDRLLKILFTSTGMVFKPTEDRHCFTENEITCPQNPYAVMKLACESILLALEHYGHHVWVARPFNHTGPGQTTDFACSAFADKIARSIPGSKIPTGPLDAIRDFSDVRDIVKAYRMILEQQPVDHKVFHLGAGQGWTMRQVFEQLALISEKEVQAEPSGNCPKLSMIADITRAREVLGWSPQYDLHETLRESYQSFQDPTSC